MSVHRYVKNWDEKSAKFYTEMENLSKKPRFGLFNHPPSNVVGDNSYDRRGPIQSAKNFYTNPKFDDGVFSRNKYVGDDYEDPFKTKQQSDLMKQGIVEPPFKPSDDKKKVIKPPYEYLSDTNYKPKDVRDEDGKVRTGPKNFYTSNLKKGFGNTTYGHLFGNYKYVEDPYDRAKELELKQWIDHKRKMLISAPFITNSTRVKTFDKDAKVYQWRPSTTANSSTRSRGMSVKDPFVVSKHYRPQTRGGSVEHVATEEAPDMNEMMKKFRTMTMKPWKPNYNGTLERPVPSLTEKFTRMHKEIKIANSFKY